MSNTVHPYNFNFTLDGYVEFTLDNVKVDLLKKGYAKEDVEAFVKSFRSWLHEAKDTMTMGEARQYRQNFERGVYK